MARKDVRGRRIGAAFIDLLLYWALSFGLFLLMADSTEGAVLWIADGFPYVLPGLVGFILILATKEHRRVADFAAGTYVVASDEVGHAPTAAALPGGPAGPPVPAAAGGPPPNWYSDPGGAPQLRWWDGTRWTDHTRPPPPG